MPESSAVRNDRSDWIGMSGAKGHDCMISL
jgi:hypothetical protein